MKIQVFDFSSYRSFLKAYFDQFGPRSGQKLAACSQMECQTSFLSQVLVGKAELSLEQGLRFNQFVQHPKEEADYFLLLLQKDRAGTQDLKSYFKDKIEEIKQRRLDLKHRLSLSAQLSEQAQTKYYSSWQYIAVHMLVSIPQLQTREALIEHLKIPHERVDEVLSFLLENGLIAQESGKFKPGSRHTHLGRDSIHIQRHHTNMRHRALYSLDQKDQKNDLHYSVMYSVSRKDALVLKEKLVAVIQANLEIVKPSPEEVVYCNVIDFFEI